MSSINRLNYYFCNINLIYVIFFAVSRLNVKIKFVYLQSNCVFIFMNSRINITTNAVETLHATSPQRITFRNVETQHATSLRRPYGTQLSRIQGFTPPTKYL